MIEWPSSGYSAEPEKEGTQKEQQPLLQAFSIAGASNIVELSDFYDREDQKLFMAGQWDYDNPTLLTNQIKELLSQVNPNMLTELQKEWRQEILWFWYHHAISCAIWQKKDKEKAKLYATEAINSQPADHPNKITRLLYFLVNDRFAEAVEWRRLINDAGEKKTADELIADYKAGKFF